MGQSVDVGPDVALREFTLPHFDLPFPTAIVSIISSPFLLHLPFLYPIRLPTHTSNAAMSSMRNAVARRNFKERAQPKDRERLGILEKRKVCCAVVHATLIH